MITVKIEINGHVIYCRSVVNITNEQYSGVGNHLNKYKNDDGKIIHHYPKDGAIVLAKKMLDTIQEF